MCGFWSTVGWTRANPWISQWERGQGRRRQRHGQHDDGERTDLRGREQWGRVQRGGHRLHAAHDRLLRQPWGRQDGKQYRQLQRQRTFEKVDGMGDADGHLPSGALTRAACVFRHEWDKIHGCGEWIHLADDQPVRQHCRRQNSECHGKLQRHGDREFGSLGDAGRPPSRPFLKDETYGRVACRFRRSVRICARQHKSTTGMQVTKLTFKAVTKASWVAGA